MFKSHYVGLAVSVWASTTTPITAEPFDGNFVLSMCESSDEMRLGICAGYFSGLVDGAAYGAMASAMTLGIENLAEVNNAIEVFIGYCVPPSATNGQIVDVNIAYLQDNPAMRHEAARGLFNLAMRDAFPCGH